jgi:hypothetical protein
MDVGRGGREKENEKREDDGIERESIERDDKLKSFVSEVKTKGEIEESNDIPLFPFFSKTTSLN